MGCMLRSDLMSYYDIYIQPESAFEIISKLGDMDCVQFVDMNQNLQAFQRSYITEICRCAEMERKLHYMEEEMVKDHVYVSDIGNERDYKALQPSEMLMFESTLEKWECDIQEISTNHSKLTSHFLELTEMYYVLTHVGNLLGDAEFRRDSLLLRKSELGPSGSLWVFTGTVLRSRCLHFEMMIWRVSSGNIFYRQASQDKILIDPQTGKEVRKVAFLCVCQGETLKMRMEKVCAGFRVNMYSVPKTLGERMEAIDSLSTRLMDIEQVLKTASYHRCKTLRTVGRQWRMWMTQVRKAKAVYHTMNLFTLDMTKKCLIGQCWVPDNDAVKVQAVLDQVSDEMGTNVSSFMSKAETVQVPPTYHRTNKFTHGFQMLINAYGDSTYREINPGLYTLITFPFLFAIMFADVCHGFIIVLFATWMIKNEKKSAKKQSNNEIWNIFLGGRYIILLMGLYAMFTGFILNEWFSRSVMLTPPHWRSNFTADQLSEAESVSLDPKTDTAIPYIFSVDPVWRLASNKILYENSIKMKLSIIIGVIHMIFGLCMCVANHLYTGHHHAIFLEFIPQVLFLVCLFLWLVFLIYFKWIFYSGQSLDIKTGPGCAPLILILFIDMFLMSKSKPPDDGCDAYMFDGQRVIQTALVIIALVCIPIMLFAPPLYRNRYNKKMRMRILRGDASASTQFRRYQRSSKARTDEPSNELEKYDVPFGEMMIHQAIHTIEFVLSTVSHTASYLRLWALSLAHSQLSEMLWEMILTKLAIERHDSPVAFLWLFAIWAVWAVFTLSILVLMEGLSAFLHTLRLHWVEFMSKFYGGGGYPFRPFSFSAILKSSDNKPESACAKRIKATYYSHR